jgi:hypothetical protein
MKKWSLSPFSFWFKRLLGLILITLATYGMTAGTETTKDMSMTARLMTQKGHLVFQISILNKTSTELNLGYGDCPLVYVLHVRNKNYTYPEKQPFTPAKICSSSLRLATLPPQSTRVVYTAQVYPDLENALIKARGNYSGEFRFILSSTTSKKMLQLIYKRQQR